MTNDNKRTWATTRQIEYVCKLAKFACSLPTHQRANVFTKLHNWARSWDNQFWIEDDIEYTRGEFAYEMNTGRSRHNSDERLTRYWRIMIGMPGYLPNSQEVFSGKSESDAIAYAIELADPGCELSRRAKRRIVRDLCLFGESPLPDSAELVWIESISRTEYENDDSWLDSFATLE